jgi:hypothetical protein
MKNLFRFIPSYLAWIACAALLFASFGRAVAQEAGQESKPTAANVGAQHEAAAGAEVAGEATKEPSFLQAFGYSYLTAYMFCLSITMGCLFLILVHHLFDAGWSVPIRRVAEQIAGLMWPWMVILVLPIVILAWMGDLHPWFKIDPATDHSLNVKKGLFNPVMFTIMVPGLVASWGWFANKFKSFSLNQDKDGAAIWTCKSRKLAAGGIYWFAFTMTLGVFYLMKSLQYQFFSTMYGVYYFAGSVWTTLATIYVIIVILRRPGMPLEQVIKKRQIHDVGMLLLTFTVFYAYIHFAQYFLIWNAAMPEETFWYVKREHGSWKWVGFTILFGHFFFPFVALLNQDVKWNLAVMIPMAAWVWLMHYVDMTFNVMPVLYPEGLHVTGFDPVLWFGMAGFLGYLFWTKFSKDPPYPLRDPRLKEAVTEHLIPKPGEAKAH